MTEQEWLEGDDPKAMQQVLWERHCHVRKAGRRKARLYACACCRGAWHLLSRRGRAWVERAERVADGDLRPTAEEEAALNRRHVRAGSPRDWAMLAASLAMSRTIRVAVDGDLFTKFALAPAELMVNPADTPEEEALAAGHADLLREIFGNPFSPLPLAPAWRPVAVVQLAQAAYRERQLPSGHLDPARLAVLSDALEEAGCDDADLLSHLRSPGPHVRGCWAIDLLTGRS